MKFNDYTLRPVQIEALDFIAKSSTAKFIGAELLTGSGKSLLAVKIQNDSSFCDIITCNNLLAEELAEKFGLIAVMGRLNYESKAEYKRIHKQASKSTNCVFNPLSYIYHQLSWGNRTPHTIVIDEAHRLISFIRNIAHHTIALESAQEFAELKPNGTNNVDEWAAYKVLSRRFKKLKYLIETHEKEREFAKAAKYQAEMMTVKFLYETVITCAPDYTFHLSKVAGKALQYELVITPVFVPKAIIKQFFNAKRLIFLSGTMPKPVFDELCFEDVAEKNYKQFAHPTPVKNRLIHWAPVAKDSRKSIIDWQKRLRPILESHKNIVFHCTYDDAKELEPILVGMGVPKKKIFTYTNKKSKNDMIANFKFGGGILLACGLDEGIDFPYAECDAVIVGRIRFPFLGDPDVSKRLAQDGGQVWYDVSTASSLFQQLGRGCRAPDDKCDMYVCDPLFPRLISKTRNYINPSLIEAVKWS